MNNFLIQGIGFIAIIFVVLAFQNKDREKLLAYILIGQTLFLIHFIFLSAWTGVAMNSIAAIRTFLFIFKEKYDIIKSKIILAPFLILFWTFGFFTWTSILSLLPILAQSIETVGLWMSKPNLIRIINLFPHPLWFIYNYSVGSIPGVIVEILVFVSILVGIYRYDIKKY